MPASPIKLSISGSLPAGVRFTDLGNGTASFAGTPALDAGGVYSLTITADNGAQSLQVFTLTVDTPPSITSQSAVVFGVGLFSSFDVTTTGFPTGPTLTLTTIGSLPPGVNFVDNGDGTATIFGTPTQTGKYEFLIVANNGISPTDTQTFTVDVINEVPTFDTPASAGFAGGDAKHLPRGVRRIDSNEPGRPCRPAFRS